MMEIEYQDILTLNDKNKYVVASKVNYNEINYVYLVDIKKPENIKFLEVKKNLLLELDYEKDRKLITTLIPLFYNNSKNDIELSIE